jgi:hypothetical protein
MNFKRPSLLFQQQSQQQVSMLFEKKQHLITPLTTQVKDVRRETAGSNGENPDNFRPDYCFHFPGISDVFLPDTVTFPHLSCRIQLKSVTGIFDIGISDDDIPEIFR